MTRPIKTDLFVDNHARRYITAQYTDTRGGSGVTVKVYTDENFVYVDTGYASRAMFHIEQLDLVIKELQRARRLIKKDAQ